MDALCCVDADGGGAVVNADEVACASNCDELEAVFLRVLDLETCVMRGLPLWVRNEAGRWGVLRETGLQRL